MNRNPIFYINRSTGKREIEKIYFEPMLRFVYGRFGKIFALLISKISFFSKLYGRLQSRPASKKKVSPFVLKYQVDLSEFEKKLEEYLSFNDFFTRKLKSGARKMEGDLVIPADGRYLCYQDISSCDGFVVKGKKFSLEKLLQNDELAKKYQKGTLVIARLCPTDYHRFHFPCDVTAGTPELINGPLYSVNPIALKKNIEILCENKRVVTPLESTRFGKVLYLEIGATNVGSIVQTFTPGRKYKTGDEKGFFSFGGSSLILLFEPSAITLAKDLQINSQTHTETLCRFGELLGK